MSAAGGGPRGTPGLSALLAGMAMCAALASPLPATAANKCLIEGTVTYQQGPCPADQARPQPSAQQLNAAQRRRRAAAASATDPAPGMAVVPGPIPRVTSQPSPAGTAPSAARFSCDGRRYCSQMRSCDEARYFLAHCPGVKMDGNRDGIPCQQQWCTS